MEKEKQQDGFLSLDEWKEVRENERTIIFGRANFLENDNENQSDTLNEKSKILFQFQRDLNDYILAKSVREGHNFHVPFVDYDKKGNYYLNREKKQTMIDAKSLDINQIKRKLKAEIEELSERDPRLADILNQIKDNVFETTDGLIHAGIKQDVESIPPKRHKHVRFRSEDISHKYNDLSKEARLDRIQGKDSMKALYNMLGPQRFDCFDQIDDETGPYLKLSKEGKKYICGSFLDIVQMYDDNDFLKGYKVFDDNNYKPYVTQIKNLYQRLGTAEGEADFDLMVDEELIAKMINFLFSKHKKLEKKDYTSSDGVFDDESFQAAKAVNNNFRNNKGTFADFLVSKFYLDNMYSQDYLDEQYIIATNTLGDFSGFTELEQKYGVGIDVKTRKKELLSQIVKLLRSSDTDTMSDQIGMEVSYYFEKSGDGGTEKEKAFLHELSAQIANLAHQITNEQKKSYGAIEFAYKGEFIPEGSIADHVEKMSGYGLDPDAIVAGRKKNVKENMTGSNGDYSDFKLVVKSGTKEQVMRNDPSMIGMEIQVKRLGNGNDRGIANHYFIRKQKFIEVFGRDRAHFSLKQYMEFFDDALKKAATNLDFRRKQIAAITDPVKKNILTEKYELDCLYAIEYNGKTVQIDLRKLDKIQGKVITGIPGLPGLTDREIADLIAHSQLKAEISEGRYKFLAYEQDILAVDLEMNESTTEKTSLVENEMGKSHLLGKQKLLSLPETIRTDSGEIHPMQMVSKNYNAALKAGHVPTSTYTSTIREGSFSVSSIPDQAFDAKVDNVYGSNKGLATFPRQAHTQKIINKAKRDIEDTL